jgi:hypothetical protein
MIQKTNKQTADRARRRREGRAKEDSAERE